MADRPSSEPSLAEPARTASLYDVGPPSPTPTPFNIAAYCLAAADTKPDAPALLVVADAAAGVDIAPEIWRYGDIADRVQRAAVGLRSRGLEAGDRVLLRLGNTPRFPLMFFATIAAGGVAVPTSAQLSEAEARFVAEDSGARFLCADPGLELTGVAAEVLDAAAIEALLSTPERLAIAETRPDDPAFLVYTSGATGKPKGVLHAQRSAWARRMMWRDWYDLRPEDRVLHAGAFNWTYTLGTGLTDPWAAGAAAVIYNGPRDPGVWPRLARATDATLFAAVPSVYRQALKYGEDLRDGFASLRHGLTAGEKLPDAVRDGWRDATGKELFEALGMSECSTFISSRPADPSTSDRTGRPQTGRRVAILPVEGGEEPTPIGEPGVLAVSRRDPGLMLGYWGRPDEEAAAMRGEWFVTGDLATMDADGDIAYLGRADDLMNAMGYRVAPQEVEDALAAHPAVAECAAAELRVRADASVVAGFVVLREGVAEPTALELIDACASRLAPYKRPREIVFVDALPRTANGKIQRKRLAAEHARA